MSDSPARSVEEAAYITASSHQFPAEQCLCGFDSHGRARSRSEHVIFEFRLVAEPLIRADERERLDPEAER